MKGNIFPQATAGSITPQLEGAAQSVSHPERSPKQPTPKSEKGGTSHE